MMALRNQPYIPLYVQDFMTDEKLMECSASTTGVYIRLMCIMHKSNEYGTILLKQKDKQKDKQVENFACKVAKHMPYTDKVVLNALLELLDESVLEIDGDVLFQKRMIHDNHVSSVRASSGSKGGKKTQSVAKAKNKATSESEYESETDNEVIPEVENKKRISAEDFDLIWLNYPGNSDNKGSKKKAKEKICGKNYSYSFDDTLTAVQNYGTLSKKVAEGFIMHLTTFLNGGFVDEWLNPDLRNVTGSKVRSNFDAIDSAELS